MSNEYPNTGALWKTKEKKHEKAPDMWGQIEFERDYLRQMLDESDDLVTIKIDAWKRESSSGNTYLSIKVNTWKPDGQQSKPAKHEDEDKDPWD